MLNPGPLFLGRELEMKKIVGMLLLPLMVLGLRSVFECLPNTPITEVLTLAQDDC